MSKPSPLIQLMKTIRISNAVVAGSADINCSSVLTTGFTSAVFTVMFGTISATCVAGLTVETSSDDGAADTWADLTGTSISISEADSNGMLQIEIVNPVEAYLRLVVNRATANAVVDGAICQLYGTVAANQPVNPDPTVKAAEIHVAPAEGTA